MVKKIEVTRMIYDKLINDTNIYTATDGKIFMALPEEEISKNLNGEHETCIYVVMAESITTGTQGSASSKIKDIHATVTIDIGSRYKNSSIYCSELLEKIENISFFDIDVSLGTTTAYLFVTSETTKVYFDNLIKCYHGILSIKFNYRTTGI